MLFASKSTCIDYESGDKITFIGTNQCEAFDRGRKIVEWVHLLQLLLTDLVTAQRLELVTSQNTGNVCPANTLFGVLNNCSTAGGQRRLRGLILQPSSDQNEINKRLDCVEELINDTNLFHSLKVSFPTMSEIDIEIETVPKDTCLTSDFIAKILGR